MRQGFFTGSMATLVLFAQALTAFAADWPQWRGANLDGISSESNVPLKWSPSENIKWKTDIPGRGHSSPIVSNGRVFLTTCIENEASRVLICLDRADGRILWQREVLSAPLERKHALNNYASATPATDGKLVFVAFLQNPKVVCVAYDFAGKEVWRKSPGTFKSMHGWATAPIIYKDLVILNCDQDDTAYLVALDRQTGEEKWRTDRPNKTRSYCVPLIIEAAGKTQMVLTGSKSVASYDPATGKQFWVIDGPTEQFVASPVYTAGIVFITAGFPTYHNVGIRPDGSGNVTQTHIAYHQKTGTYVPSPLAHEGLIYMVSDKPGAEGEAWCLDAATGDLMWKQRLGKHHRPSPVYAAGNVYFLSDEGDMFVIKAGRQFELVSKNSLGEECNASPAVSDGDIFIRTTQRLWCIGK